MALFLRDENVGVEHRRIVWRHIVSLFHEVEEGKKAPKLTINVGFSDDDGAIPADIHARAQCWVAKNGRVP